MFNGTTFHSYIRCRPISWTYLHKQQMSELPSMTVFQVLSLLEPCYERKLAHLLDVCFKSLRHWSIIDVLTRYLLLVVAYFWWHILWHRLLSLALFRKQQFENQLLVNTWKVKWEDIEPLRSGKTKDGSTVCPCNFTATVGKQVHFWERGYWPFNPYRLHRISYN